MDPAQRRILMQRLTRDADRICARFGLRYRSLECERRNVTSRYGICYDDGTIKIRLWHVTTREPLKYSSLVNTLCHELAHLRHFNHGPRFQRFYAQLLEGARAEGIYRPRRNGAAPARRPSPPDDLVFSNGASPRHPFRPQAHPKPHPQPRPEPHPAREPARPPEKPRRRKPREGPSQLELF